MQTVSIVKAQNFIASKDLKAFKLPTRVCGWLVPSLVLYSRASSSKRDLRKHFAFASRQNHEYSSTASASSNIQIVFQFHSRNFFSAVHLSWNFMLFSASHASLRRRRLTGFWSWRWVWCSAARVFALEISWAAVAFLRSHPAVNCHLSMTLILEPCDEYFINWLTGIIRPGEWSRLMTSRAQLKAITVALAPAIMPDDSWKFHDNDRRFQYRELNNNDCEPRERERESRFS
jgi:hypothetical protein